MSEVSSTVPVMVFWNSKSWPSTLLAALTMLTSSQANLVFSLLFIFRYTRLIVNTIAFYFMYNPTPIPAEPTINPRDCTVIIPTVDPENAGFLECIRTVLQNQPGAVLIVTVGNVRVKLVKKVVKPFRRAWPSTTISVTSTNVANKRLQVCHALPQVNTALTVLVDDHVYWPSLNFLRTVCAPFEDRKVGGVGTNKVVRRTGSGYSKSSIFNFWGCVYLERHNFELAATNAIDGSVFVLSGRTSVHRTQILKDPEFLRGFANEKFFFGKFGPIAADDDNFITRWEVKHGWDIKFQYCDDACIETDLGAPGKFLSQCMRWVRTTWRSNSCSLFTDRTIWRRQPWGVYAIYISSFFNFALFYDFALTYALLKTTFGHSWTARFIMAAWTFASRMIKLIPHFCRHPADLMLIPAYLLFAYCHSFMKLWALFTFWDIAWSGRNLSAVDADVRNEGSSDDSDEDDEDDDEDDDDDDTDSKLRKSSQSGDSHAATYSMSSDLHSSRGMRRSQSTKGGSRNSSTRIQEGELIDAISARQVLFDRFFGTDDDQIPALSSLASSSGSSTQSASYGISRRSTWEKASSYSTAVSQPRARLLSPPSHSIRPWGNSILSTNTGLQRQIRRQSSPNRSSLRAKQEKTSSPSPLSEAHAPPQPRESHSAQSLRSRPLILHPLTSPASAPSRSRSQSLTHPLVSSPLPMSPSPHIPHEPCPPIKLEALDEPLYDIPAANIDADVDMTCMRERTQACATTPSTPAPMLPPSIMSNDISWDNKGSGHCVVALRAVRSGHVGVGSPKQLRFRSRGVDCGRQHADARWLSAEGRCLLPAWVGNVGIA